MNNLDPLDSNSASDGNFVARLRRVAPASSPVALEEVMFRAGFESAMKQRMGAQPRWQGFALGMGSGALAAGLIWFCTGLPFFIRMTSNQSDFAKASNSKPASVIPIQERPDSLHASHVSEDAIPSANPFLRKGELDMLRDSLSQIAKRQWDQRRLSERTQWVSSRVAPNTDSEAETNETISPSSLWRIRNQSAPQRGL